MSRLLLALLSLLVSSTATAAPRPELLVETDPSTFVLGGFSLHVRTAAPTLPRWTFGAGVYALDLPRLMVELAPDNRDRDWDARIRLGYGVFVDRYFRADRARGGFVGLQLALQHLRVANPDVREAAFTNVLAMPRIGYSWHPRDGRFYLLGWAGLGATGTLAGERRGYDVLPVIAFGAIHVGFQM